MSALERIAFYQNRRDEVPNQELAHELAATSDAAGIAEIAANLANTNQSVRSDCLKVLYEIGYPKPELIADYVRAFLDLLASRDNRMVWGGMIALSTIAALRSAEIWARIDDVLRAMEHGSVITVDAGVKTLTGVAAANAAYSVRLFPRLLEVLRTCIPRDVPRHAVDSLPAVNAENREAFLAVLAAREPELSPSQRTRLRTVENRVRTLRSPTSGVSSEQGGAR
jgi:hypothetical protein